MDDLCPERCPRWDVPCGIPPHRDSIAHYAGGVMPDGTRWHHSWYQPVLVPTSALEDQARVNLVESVPRLPARLARRRR
jgi:hypothetical protein